LSLAVSTQAPLQSVKPALQAKPQMPPLQVGVAFATLVVQACAHPPQFWTSVCSSTHAPPQITCDPGQLAPQVGIDDPSPGEHTEVPASALHASPQRPQFVVVFSFTHAPPQSE
jgi:hypothetical protein